jgi:hypothetical protein
MLIRRGEPVSLSFISQISTGKIFVNKPEIPQIIENIKSSNNIVDLTMDETGIKFRDKNKKVSDYTAKIVCAETNNQKHLLVYLEPNKDKVINSRRSTNTVVYEYRSLAQQEYQLTFNDWMINKFN